MDGTDKLTHLGVDGPNWPDQLTISAEDAENLNILSGIIPASATSEGTLPSHSRTEEIFEGVDVERKDLKIAPQDVPEFFGSNQKRDSNVFDDFGDCGSSRHRNPGDHFASVVKLANHVDAMDPESIMQVVENKILESFSTWDLIVRRSKLYQMNEGVSGRNNSSAVPNLIQLLVNGVESLLNQIGKFLTDYMEPIELNPSEDVSNWDDVVEIDEVISAALGLVRGTWKVTKTPSNFPENYKQLFNNASSIFAPKPAKRRKQCRRPRKQKAAARNEEENPEGDLNEDQDEDAKVDLVDDAEEYVKNKVYNCICDVCFTPILNEECLRRHGAICNGQSEIKVRYSDDKKGAYCCEMQGCKEKFTSESGAITHCFKDHFDINTRASLCDECGLKFSNPRLRRRHHQRVHDKKFICSVCGCRFWRERLLREHFLKHSGEKPFKCDRENCNYATTSIGLLRKHSKRHAEGVLKVDNFDDAAGSGDKSRLPKYFQSCRNNRYNVTLRDTPTLHSPPAREDIGDIVVKKEQYDPNSSLPYHCDRCNHVYAHFSTEYALKIHMKYCTGSNRNKEHCLWTCDGGCGKEFFYLRSLKEHRPKCNGVKTVSAQWKRSPVSGEYMCGVPGCKSNETWIGMYGLRQHFFAEHVTEEDKIFKCDYCDARFAYKTMKNEHMRKFHLRQHICSYCGRAFAEKHKLRDHQFMHTGEKPFACEHCEYRAAKKYNLDAHKLAKHGDTSGRSFFCETCGRSFLTKSNLRGHITVVHEGGRAINLNNGTTRKK